MCIDGPQGEAGHCREVHRELPPARRRIPGGWKRFFAIRNLADENEVITFGLFDGDLDQLNASQAEDNKYEDRINAVAPFIESTGTSGVFEVLVDQSID